jgi:hypothetical protein
LWCTTRTCESIARRDRVRARREGSLSRVRRVARAIGALPDGHFLG